MNNCAIIEHSQKKQKKVLTWRVRLFENSFETENLFLANFWSILQNSDIVVDLIKRNANSSSLADKSQFPHKHIK